MESMLKCESFLTFNNSKIYFLKFPNSMLTIQFPFPFLNQVSKSEGSLIAGNPPE